MRQRDTSTRATKPNHHRTNMDVLIQRAPVVRIVLTQEETWHGGEKEAQLPNPQEQNQGNVFGSSVTVMPRQNYSEHRGVDINTMVNSVMSHYDYMK